MPCPNGVNIPGIFSAWNKQSLYNLDPRHNWDYGQLVQRGETADRCVACGACEAACPQHLAIIDGLKNAWSALNG